MRKTHPQLGDRHLVLGAVNTSESDTRIGGIQWIPLAPGYLMVRRIRTLIWCPALCLAIGAALWRFTTGWLVPLIWLGIGVVWVIFVFFRQSRVYRNMGYFEGPTDLFLRTGVMFKKITVIPYGRMQTVEVGSGPIDRALGLAHVTMTTAGPALSIQGLPEKEATELRDRLSEFGRTQQAGL